MFRIAIAYILLILALGFPPLLLVAIPMVVLQTVRLIQGRDRAAKVAHRVALERQNQAVVRYFR